MITGSKDHIRQRDLDTLNYGIPYFHIARFIAFCISGLLALLRPASPDCQGESPTLLQQYGGPVLLGSVDPGRWPCWFIHLRTS